MKLITEHIEDVQVITEAKKDGSKKYIIEGIFMQANKPNRNGRMYPREILESAVNKYVTEQVSKGRAVGELNHPEGPTINLDKVSHKITELSWDGNNVVGKATILDTPMGLIVQGLLDGEVQVGVSSRGMGSLANKGGVNVVNNDFMLNAVDIVQDPSAPEAFVNGVMEGVEWIFENGIFKQQEIEQFETEIKRAPNADMQVKAFKDFLSKL
tara:strand:+ start:6518 stop:7153 length:636 start_codon:yes stop_codon:yes gene_type:complete